MVNGFRHSLPFANGSDQPLAEMIEYLKSVIGGQGSIGGTLLLNRRLFYGRYLLQDSGCKVGITLTL